MRPDRWGLERKVVHVIDREADALGRMREWSAAGHRFLVRSDDRRVLWNGESWLIAETGIVLHRSHSAVIDGKKRQFAASRWRCGWSSHV